MNSSSPAAAGLRSNCLCSVPFISLPGLLFCPRIEVAVPEDGSIVAGCYNSVPTDMISDVS